MEGPLRIAMVHASDLGGGAERSVVSLHRALRARGHAVTLFVGDKRTAEPGVEAISYVRGLPGSRRAARWLEQRFGWQDIYNPSFRALAEHLPGRFDVVHFHSLWGSAGYADLAALPAITRRLPGVLTLREQWMLTGHCACFFDCRRWQTGCGSCPDLSIPPAIPRDGTRFNWQRKRRLIAASRLHLVAISDHLKRQMAQSPILREKPMHRIYNGIDLSVFVPPPADERRRLRQNLGFADADTVVLLTGQTVEGLRQGIAAHHAIAAMNACSDLSALRALVVGPSAEQFTQALQVPAKTLPFQRSEAEMARCYQLADVTLVTSKVEAFGRIAAESQACGTPVVAFGADAIPEVVLDSVGGLVVPPEDTAALGAALRRMLLDAELRKRCARAGREHVARQFDERHVADQYLCVYRKILGGRPTHA
jgi:glycosyltransferase involved in cell wall biosynthesis